MAFQEKFQQVAEILSNIGSKVYEKDYDGLIVKRLEASNTLDKGRTTKQSHIAITGPQMDMFPYVRADGYFEVDYDDEDPELKKYFVAQIPVYLHKENVEYLDSGTVLFTENEKLVHISIVRSRRKDAADQIQMSMTYMDTPTYVDYRRIVHAGSYMILLKRKSELKYDMYSVKPEDIEVNGVSLAKLNNCFEKMSTNTVVHLDEIFEEECDDSEINTSEELVFKTGLETPYERNRIVFGAPGTGKSYLLKEDVKEVTKSYGGTVVERVTFHPEYSYSQFVGTYKPTMIEVEPTTHLDDDKKEILAILRDNSLSAQEKYDLLYARFKEEGLTRLPLLLGLYCDDSFKTKKQDGTDAVGDNSVERNHGRAIRPYVNLAEKANGKSEIAYEYVPGPFMRMYVSALRSARNLMPQPHILIIEEINRAKVAAVFGDVFQLLDRDEDGVSEYDIQASEDIKKYLAKELGGSPKDYSRIRIPDNMFIWATMNSADQGVFPMDTAFKRRWNFEYLGIDENAEKIAGIGKIILEGSDETIEWNRLRKAINAKMSSSEFKINEDKLMGPFFLSKKAIASNENGMIINKKAFIDAFKSKVIMYLYEDAVKQGKHRFFDGCPDTGKYSAVCDAFDKIGTKIFGATFREDFYDKED